MKLLKSGLVSFLSIVMSQTAFAQANPNEGVWARFTCKLESALTPAEELKSISFDIGKADEGWPLLALLEDGKDILEGIRQFYFEYSPSNFKIIGSIAWIEKIDPIENSRNPIYNRILSRIKIDTVTTVSESIETRIYKVSRVTTNVDADNSSSTRALSSYICEEPELF